MAEPVQPKKVGRGLEAPRKSPKDPQSWLAGSNHPYAPFTGNALKWESWVYDDGTTFEGLTREEAPHVKGVMVLGNGLGGGLQSAEQGDKYEGEFNAGFVHGLGQYTGANGEVYRGEWLYGKRHGCGALVNTAPFLKKVEKGMDPAKAWESTREEVEKQTRYGTWKSDHFLTGPDDSGRFCHMLEIKGVLQELESVVTKARMFQFKPDGEVTYRMAQDAVGLPAPLMQDPIHYPHGTKFMAPGPMGQCFPLPEDDHVKETMQTHAENYEKIFNSYNFDVVPTPGSDMDKAQRLWDAQVAKKKAARRRVIEAEKRRLQRLNRSKPAAQQQQEQQQSAVDASDDSDDNDLQASAPASGSRGSQPPTVFASLSLGWGHMSQMAGAAIQSMAADTQRRFRPLFPPCQG